MAAPFEQTFAAEAATLATLRAAVRDYCAGLACPHELSEQLVLAINEAGMNIIKHGYAGATGQSFTLRLRCDDDVLTADLLDNGQPACDADLRPRKLDEIRPGGLGVHFMRELLDSMAYVQAPQGFTNCLQLKKRIF